MNTIPRCFKQHFKPISLFLSLSFLAAGCVTAPVVPEYSEPQISIKRVSEFRDVRLGLLESENVEKSKQYIQEHKTKLESFGMFTNASALEDADPEYPIRKLHQLLQGHFKDVVPLRSLEEAGDRGVDLCMLLDIRYTLSRCLSTRRPPSGTS